jgi:glucose-6-phosphate 1-epimerase
MKRDELPASVTESGEALPSLAIVNRHARARIYLHGAHVASFRPTGEGEILWMSARSSFAAGKPIRGGVPICFPWFGPHAERADLPVHGLVRTLPWSLAAAEDLPDGGTRVRLTLGASAETRALWPHDFELAYTVTVGATLGLALDVRNIEGRNVETAPFAFEEALHTYFDVADVRRCSIRGLEGARYRDKVGGGDDHAQAGAITFDGETDRVYRATTATCVVEDAVQGRRIVVDKSGSRTTVVWNPWVAKAARMPDFGDHEWPGMVCVETANAGTERISLAPGASHLMSARIGVRRG